MVASIEDVFEPEQQEQSFDDLIAAINSAEETSYGAEHDTELASERAGAIDFYLGRNLDPAPKGRSQVVDRSVFEVIQWTLPSLLRIFANGDNVVAFEPEGEEDVEAAEQESDYLNYQVTQRNAWYEICETWFTDALLTKNAYCLAFWDNKRHVEIETYENQTPEGVALLLSENDVEVVAHKEYPDPDQEPQPVLDPQASQAAGQPVPMIDPFGQIQFEQPMLHSVQIRRVKPISKLGLKVLPPERCKIHERTPTWDLRECPYFEYYDWISISELRSQGFDVDDDISSDSLNANLQEDTARDQFYENSTQETEHTADPSMRRVKARMVWIRYDFDGDGIAELQYVLLVGNTVLFHEEINRIPVSCIVPHPLPHRHIGLSQADTVAEVQRVKTAIMRQGQDNLYLSNNARTAIGDKVNIDDLTISRPNGVVRVEDGAIPTDQIMPLTVPFVFPQTLEGLEYWDRVRESRAGVNKVFQGIDENAMQGTATGMLQLSSMAAQRVEHMARIFGAGIEYLFSICHELILKHGHQSETVRLRGKWVEVDPSNWRRREDLRVTVAYAAGNSDSMIAKIMALLRVQQEGMGSIATPEDQYNAVTELIRAMDFPSAEKFATSPEDIPPPPPPPPDPVLVAQQVEVEKDLQVETMKNQDKEAEREADVAIRKYVADLQARTQVMLAQIKAGQSTGETVEPMSISMSSEKLDEAANIVSSNSGQTAEAVGVMAEAVQKMSEALSLASADKEIVRDEDGKAIGSRIVQ